MRCQSSVQNTRAEKDIEQRIRAEDGSVDEVSYTRAASKVNDIQ